MMPAEMSMSPVSAPSARSSASAVSVQRVFSPPRPPISFSARSSLTAHSSISFSRFSFLRVLAFSSASIAASLSFSSASSACLARRPTMTSSYCPSASFSLACLGATTLATLS